MVALLLAVAAAGACSAVGSWCGQDVPCRWDRDGRDEQGIRHVVLEESLPAALAEGRTAALWLVYPEFKPFQAQMGAHRTSVATPQGTFSLCLVPDVSARQSSASRSGAPMEGGLVLFSYDAAPAPMPSFPLDDIFEVARAAGLLTAPQLARLAELDKQVPKRVEAIGEAYGRLRESPYLAYSRKALFARLRSFDDPAPAVPREGLRPDRFFDRGQREALRSRGQRIAGRCSIALFSGRAEVHLADCPLGQLADEWNRVRGELTEGTPKATARRDRGHLEVPALSLEMADVAPPVAAQRILGLLSAIEGFETTPSH